MADVPYSANIKQLEVLIRGGETIAGKGGWSNGMAKTAQRLRADADMAVDHVFMPDKTLFDTHSHASTEILICISGQLTVKTNDEQHQLRPTDVLKISPETPHSCLAVGDTWVVGLLVAFYSPQSQGPVL